MRCDMRKLPPRVRECCSGLSWRKPCANRQLSRRVPKTSQKTVSPRRDFRKDSRNYVISVFAGDATKFKKMANAASAASLHVHRYFTKTSGNKKLHRSLSPVFDRQKATAN